MESKRERKWRWRDADGDGEEEEETQYQTETTISDAMSLNNEKVPRSPNPTSQQTQQAQLANQPTTNQLVSQARNQNRTKTPL